VPNITPPPVPTQSQMLTSQGLVSRPWLSWFTTLGQIFGFNQTIQANGVAVPQEVALNFTSGFSVTDNPTKGSTDIGIVTVATTQMVITLAFGETVQNTTSSAKRIYLYIQTDGSEAGTAQVRSDDSDTPSTLIAQVSAIPSPGGGSASVSLPFEVLPGNYYTLSQDSGSLSIVLAVEVQ
jgi:hypothetical protein